MSTKVKYVGTHTAGVFLPGDVFVEHGAVVEVDDALAADLCGRVRNGEPQWELAGKKTTTTPAVSAEEI